jgi:hypothetical protein
MERRDFLFSMKQSFKPGTLVRLSRNQYGHYSAVTYVPKGEHNEWFELHSKDIGIFLETIEEKEFEGFRDSSDIILVKDQIIEVDVGVMKAYPVGKNIRTCK